MSLSNRYFLLVFFSLVLALVAGAGAMRLVAGPILTQLQQTALREESRTIGLLVSNMLDVRQRELELLAGDSKVVTAALGEADSLARVDDLISRFAETSGYSGLSLYDILSETIVGQDFAQAEDAKALTALATDIIDADSAVTRVAFRQSDDGLLFYLAVPVLLNGTVEGVLGGTFLSDLRLGAGVSEFARNVSIIRHKSIDVTVEDGSIFAPISDTGLSVWIDPDTEGLHGIRDELILTVTLALFGALAIPFGVLAYGGRLAIVVPTQRLIESENKLLQSQKQLSEFLVLVKTSNDAILVTDKAGCILWINTAFSQLTGFSLEEVAGRKPGPILQGEDTDPETAARISRAIANGHSIQTKICNYRKDGSAYWIELYISPMWDETGEIYKFFAVSRNITDQLERERELVKAHKAVETQAVHDALTGLPNRRFVTKWLEENRSSSYTAIRVDLDHFKFVNDTLGHDAGDHVLKHVSDLLRSRAGPDDVVARVGGDEFIILLAGSVEADAPEALCRKVLCDLEKDIPFKDKQCRVGASFGIAGTTDDLLDEKDIVSCADVALYLAKESGRNTVVHYTKAVHANVLNARTMSVELEEALETGAFVPYYQPIYSAKNKRICGAEVLLRWQHPRLGLIKPKTFLKLADQLSLMDKIEAKLFEAVLEDLKIFQGVGIVLPRVAINISRDRLLDPGLLPSLEKLQNTGVQVSLEILESFLLDDTSKHLGTLQTLKEHGIELSVDHFGTGHASIIGLNRLRPDTMKIDKRLTMPITKDETSRKLYQSIVEIGRNLDISITAVGVETTEHANLLLAMGVDKMQGFFFSPSLPADKFLAFCLSNGAVAGNDSRFVALQASGL